MNAVSYLRVSTKEQAEEGYSIAAQEAACRSFIAERGWKLVEVFADRGESARTAERPQFQTLLRFLEDDRTIRYLVVHKLDRLARNIRDYANVRDLLDKLGVQLVSVTEGLEATASGKMVEGMLAVVAEWYSNNLSGEIRKGQMQKILEGDWPTMAPIGYQNVRLDPKPGQRRGRATIVPYAQAALVRQAFEFYATGHYPLTDLSNEMHARGLLNRRGGRVSRSCLGDLLKNPAYIGKIPWKGEVFDGSHEPIVSRELFDQVRQVLASHGRSKERQRKHTHFLKGILSCSSCGRRLLYNVVKNHAKDDFAYYVCATRFTPGAKCDQPYVLARELERQVEDLYKQVRTPAGLERRLEVLLEEEISQLERNRAHNTHFIAKRLQRLSSEKDRLVDLYLHGDIDRETFRNRKSAIEAEIIDLEAKMGDQTERIRETRKIITVALKLARNCYRSYRKASPETKKLWNQAFFSKIMVEDKKVARVTYQEPFEALLRSRGSNKKLLVERSGFEPPTSSVRGKRSTS